MSEPLVCAIMLTRDRPEMARRAVECFRDQTYERKKLLVYNSGESDEIECGCGPECFHVKIEFYEPQTIGHLRNLANSFRTGYGHEQSDILIHWDDDDWSHPNRIAEQVALLQSSGADVVGYNEMLFWDSRLGQFCGAWLYSNPAPRYALGTSFCYWRSTWERTPFPPTSQGEDVQFLARAGKIAAVSSSCRSGQPGVSTSPDNPSPKDRDTADHGPGDSPRIVASIHGGNASNAYDPEKMREAAEWRRVPDWDAALRERMKL